MGPDDAVLVDLRAVLPEQCLHQPGVAVRRIVQGPVLVQQFVDRTRILSRMALAHQHRRLVVEQGFTGKLLGGLRRVQLADGEIHAAVAQQWLGHGHQAFVQFQPDVRHPLAKCQDHFGQECQGDPGRDPDAKPALGLATHVIEFGLRMFELFDHQARVGQQDFAVRGEVQAAGGSAEQGQLLTGFQLP
ncbi:hypothetical protein D3C76_1082670 [compost metagenome]